MSGTQSEDTDRSVGWARRLLADGTAPDPSFTLANERTFLSWIRTALAIIAVGVGVALTGGLIVAPLRTVVATVFSTSGAVLAAAAFHRWLRTERALRRAESLPPPTLAPLIAYGLAGCTMVLLFAALFAR